MEPFQNLIKKVESPKMSKKKENPFCETTYIPFTQKNLWTQAGVPNLIYMFYMHIISQKITGLLHELNHYPQTNMHKSSACVPTHMPVYHCHKPVS